MRGKGPFAQDELITVSTLTGSSDSLDSDRGKSSGGADAPSGVKFKVPWGSLEAPLATDYSFVERSKKPRWQVISLDLKLDRFRKVWLNLFGNIGESGFVGRGVLRRSLRMATSQDLLKTAGLLGAPSAFCFPAPQLQGD